MHLENRNNRAFKGLLHGFSAGMWISTGGPLNATAPCDH